MTQATVSIVRPEEAHAEFGKLADRRRRLLEREADLIQRGGQAQAQGRVDLTDRLGAELRSIRAELDGLQLDFTATEFDAKEASRARLLADKNYRGLVKLAAEALAARLALWVPLSQAIAQAGAVGVLVTAMPVGVLAELAEARTWTQKQVQDGVLDAASLPAPLAVLVGVTS